MIDVSVSLDRDPAVNERAARRATRICGTSGCELSGSEASLVATGGEPTRIRNVRALIVRR
jgi:hypothetical protein